ncbi:MAG TPA: OB-fold domain-containing protein [Acidimicrobiia bacterium]|nr:OB-fold domain-containing protein [Acidimicrobiia bacterium]
MSGRQVPVHEGLFETTGDEVALLASRCRSCGHYQFPAATTCPSCRGDDVETVTLSSTGTLWGWTAVHAAPPGYDGPVPFGFGVVELPEGLRVITRLEATDVDALRFGMSVHAAIAALHANEDGDTVVTYTFVPVP